MPECAECRFYREGVTSEGQCRRRAPKPYNFLKYYELELIRDIAWSLAVVAKVAEKSHDVLTEATEAFESAWWPNVQPDDWCGEFDAKESTAYREYVLSKNPLPR